MEGKKYVAYLVGTNPNPANWKKLEMTIRVDSLEEAEDWCKSNYQYLNLKVEKLVKLEDVV